MSSSLLKSFVEFFRQHEKVILFQSPGSIRCYKIPISFVETELAATIANLKRSFFWTIRTGPHHKEDKGTVSGFISDDFRLLTSWNDAKLIEAIKFRDNYSNGIWFELIGFHHRPKDLLTSAQIKDELTRLFHFEPSNIAVVIIRMGDTPMWYVYTARNIPETVDQFIKNDLHVSKAKSIKRRGYRWLHMMRLEKYTEPPGW